MIYRTMIAAIMMGVAVSPAWAVEHWQATSRTATAITGDITLEVNRIVFNGGKSLPITRDKNITFDDESGRKVPASLYRVTMPGDPSLVGGNRLCGGPEGPVTYIIIWRVKPIMPGNAEGRAFAAYAGRNEPQPSTRGACGTYYYEIMK